MALLLPQPEELTLLTLPSEIRVKIYKFVYGDRIKLRSYIWHHDADEYTKKDFHYDVGPCKPWNLLLVCRQIYKEAQPIAEQCPVHIFGTDYYDTCDMRRHFPQAMLERVQYITQLEQQYTLSRFLDSAWLAPFSNLRVLELVPEPNSANICLCLQVSNQEIRNLFDSEHPGILEGRHWMAKLDRGLHGTYGWFNTEDVERYLRENEIKVKGRIIVSVILPDLVAFYGGSSSPESIDLVGSHPRSRWWAMRNFVSGAYEMDKDSFKVSDLKDETGYITGVTPIDDVEELWHEDFQWWKNVRSGTPCWYGNFPDE